MPINNKYIARVVNALTYIDDHIHEGISVEQVAQTANYSKFHFSRIFKALTGESIKEYMNRIRIQNASQRLAGRELITHIAHDSGFTDSSAFNKAFKKIQGMNPKEYRQYATDALLKRAAEIEKSCDAAIEKKPKIVELESLAVKFVRGEGEFGKHTWEAWSHLWHNISDQNLDYSNLRLFAISHDNPEFVKERHRYDACVVDQGSLHKEGRVGEKTIGGGSYARFLHKGPYENFKHSFAGIYLFWALETSFHLDNRPWLVEFLNWQIHEAQPDKLESYIYVPLERNLSG